MKKDTRDGKGCPCLYLDEPCSDMCTCVNPFSSRGCDYCATYGSIEQRKAKSKWLKNIIDAEIEKLKKIREER